MNSEQLRILENGDLVGFVSYWKANMPHLPVPQSKHDVEATLHRVRTEAEGVSEAKRFYSHRWLCDRNLPSALPDHLKPSAERLYPSFIEAVGISVNSQNEYLQPAMKIIEKSMSDAVADIYANGDQHNLELVKQRMQEARVKESINLFGRFKYKS